MADPPINPFVPLTEEERQKLLVSSTQPTIPSLYSIPPLRQDPNLLKGGITPQGVAQQRYAGMIPPSAGALGIRPGEHGYGEQNQARLDFQKLHPWGDPTISEHPGTWGKIGHVLGRIGNIAGNVLIPGVMENIPGTDLAKQREAYRNANWIRLGAETEEKRAQTEEAKARVPYYQAEAWKAKHPTATNIVELAQQDPEAAQKVLQMEQDVKPEPKETTDEALARVMRGGKGPGDPEYDRIIAAKQAERPEKQVNTKEDLQNQLAQAFEKGDMATVKKLQNELKTIDPFGAERLGLAEAAGNLAQQRFGFEQQKNAQRLEEFNPTIQPRVVDAMGSQQSTRRLLGILEQYKNDNQPFSNFLRTVEYRLGKDQADQVGRELAAINLASLQQGGVVLKGMGGVRSAQVLEQVLQHTPNPLKDSTALMYQKLLNIDRATSTFLQEANQYGRKQGVQLPGESMKPYAPPAGGQEPPRPANVPDNYVFKADGPKGAGWYKP